MDTGWTSSTDIDEIAAALAEALPTLTDLAKDQSAEVAMKAGGTYSYKYANLASALAEVRPKLAEHGVMVIQSAHGGPKAVSVTTTLLHRSGQWIAFAPLSLDAGSTPQSAGSAITYARRYSLLPAVGLATEDDDGQHARAQVERDELTIEMKKADWYVERATLAGLSHEEQMELVKGATNGRTDQARLVLESEFQELEDSTRALVTRKRQDADAETANVPSGSEEADPDSGASSTEADDAQWRAEARADTRGPGSSGASGGSSNTPDGDVANAEGAPHAAAEAPETGATAEGTPGAGIGPPAAAQPPLSDSTAPPAAAGTVRGRRSGR